MGFELNPSVKSIYHSGQKTYHLTQISRDHVVDSSGLDGSIGAYGRHGGGCDDGDQVGDADELSGRYAIKRNPSSEQKLNIRSGRIHQ